MQHLHIWFITTFSGRKSIPIFNYHVCRNNKYTILYYAWIMPIHTPYHSVLCSRSYKNHIFTIFFLGFGLTVIPRRRCGNTAAGTALCRTCADSSRSGRTWSGPRIRHLFDLKWQFIVRDLMKSKMCFKFLQ